MYKIIKVVNPNSKMALTFDSILIPSNCLEKSMQFYGKILVVVCHLTFLLGLRMSDCHSHPTGFVSYAGIEIIALPVFSLVPATIIKLAVNRTFNP